MNGASAVTMPPLVKPWSDDHRPRCKTGSCNEIDDVVVSQVNRGKDKAADKREEQIKKQSIVPEGKK